MRVMLNILGYQVAWWAAVLSARAGAEWIGLAVTAVVLVLHLLVSPARRSEAWFIPLAAAVGYAADTLATLLGALEFNSNPHSILPAPLWVAALWVAFATTLNCSLSWLRSRLVLAAVLGAASGPLAYAAGVALDVVAMPSPVLSTVVLAVLWGATLPIVMLIAAWASRQQHPADTPLQECLGDAA